VGCDGGKSLVRQTMGIDRGARHFDERMVLAVFRSKELHEYLDRFPPATTYRVMKPQLEGYGSRPNGSPRFRPGVSGGRATLAASGRFECRQP
jgi:hypothetical protein